MTVGLDSKVFWLDESSNTEAFSAIRTRKWDPFYHEDRGILGYANPEIANDIIWLYNFVNSEVSRLEGNREDIFGHYQELLAFVSDLKAIVDGRPGSDNSKVKVSTDARN